MKSNLFTLLRFVAALLTVAAILGKPYLPPERLVIYPAADTVTHLYGARDADGNDNFGWIDQDKNSWWCDYRIGLAPCGMNMQWGETVSPNIVPTHGHPPCRYIDTDEDGDGWGWENERSCEVTAATRAAGMRLSASDDCTHSSADNKPDGEPCGARTSEAAVAATSEAPVCLDPASDPDGDGWGWENEASCVVSANISNQPSHSSATNALTNPTQPIAQNAMGEAIDFSRYDRMKVNIHYEGKAKYLNLYLRHQTPHPPDEDIGRGKFMSVYLRTDDLKAGPATVDLSEFSVAEWWITATNAPRDQAMPEFSKIFSLGIDQIDPGMHKIRIDSVELVGERISTKNFLLAILFFWCAFLLNEAALRYYWLYRASRQSEARIDNLTSTAELLEQEKHQLETLATTDALTGVFNREGVRQHLHSAYGGEFLPSDFGVLMIDIDHFKQVNDTHGHGVGDVILKSLAQLIMANIREGDIFARWGGEEFVLFARDTGGDSLFAFAEKLRALVANESMEPSLNLHITISIGVATVRRGDTFSATLKRADMALYRAKKTRNCVALEK